MESAWTSCVSWLWQHPVALVVVVILVEKIVTGLAVWATYPADPKEWLRIKRQEPRRAALVLFLRGWGFYPAKVVAGVRGLWLGALPKDVQAAIERVDESKDEKQS